MSEKAKALWDKLPKRTDILTFLNEINRTDAYKVCSGCHHPNGECVDFALEGTCKAYGRLPKENKEKLKD